MYHRKSYLAKSIEKGLKQNGYYICRPDLLSIDLLNQISNTGLSNIARADSNDEYAGGRLLVYNQMEVVATKQEEPIKQYTEYCLGLLAETRYHESKHIATFQTLDTPLSNHIAQAPHFDRIPTIKFMLYLNDLTPKNGAFWLSPGSHNWVKDSFSCRRPEHQDNEFFRKTRDIPKNILATLKPVPGNRGTIIVFDTDCVHHQGIVLKGQCNILRSHFR